MKDHPDSDQHKTTLSADVTTIKTSEVSSSDTIYDPWCSPLTGYQERGWCRVHSRVLEAGWAPAVYVQRTRPLSLALIHA